MGVSSIHNRNEMGRGDQHGLAISEPDRPAGSGPGRESGPECMPELHCHAGTHRDTDAHSHPHTHTHADTNADAYPNPHPDSDSHAHADRDAHAHADTESDVASLRGGLHR
jgi:hypothetical protein